MKKLWMQVITSVGFCLIAVGFSSQVLAENPNYSVSQGSGNPFEKPKSKTPTQPTPPPVTQKAPAKVPVATASKPTPPPVTQKAPAKVPVAPPPSKQPVTNTKALETCKQNCQKQYDLKIQNCAGYRLGNTAKACKDPIERDKQACLSTCR